MHVNKDCMMERNKKVEEEVLIALDDPFPLCLACNVCSFHFPLCFPSVISVCYPQFPVTHCLTLGHFKDFKIQKLLINLYD